MKKIILSVTVLLLLVGCRQAWERDVKTDIIVSYDKDMVSFKNKNFDSITLIGATTDFYNKDTLKFNKTYLVDSSYIAISFKEETKGRGSYPKIYIDTIKAVYNDTTYYYLPYRNYLLNKEDDYYSTSYLTQNQKIVEAKILKEKLLYRDSIIITVSMLSTLLSTLIFALVAYKREKNRKFRRVEEIERLKNLYERTDEPLLIHGSYINTTQKQTKQLSTGALLYSLPEEHILSFTIQNISPKDVEAVGVLLVYMDAFEDIVDMVSLSSECIVAPYDAKYIEKYIDRPSDIVNFTVIINKVKFSDGTIWQR